MGNKSVRPKVNQVPGVPVIAREISQSQKLPSQVNQPNVTHRRTGKKPPFRCPRRTNLSCTTPNQKEVNSPNYTEIEYPPVERGNTIPVRAQRPHPSNQRKSDRNGHNAPSRSTLRAKQPGSAKTELLSYPFGRVKCRSQMSDCPAGTCCPAQLYRLTEPTRGQYRACSPRGVYNPRHSMGPGRSLCRSALACRTPAASPEPVNHSLNMINVNSPLFQVVPSLKPIAELLQEFNRLCLLLPDTLRHAMDDLIDYNMFTHIKQNEAHQQHLLSASIRSNLALLSELIPLMSQHILNAQDLFQSLHRMEEKFLTFQRLVEQLNLWANPPQTKYALGDQHVAD